MNSIPGVFTGFILIDVIALPLFVACTAITLTKFFVTNH